MYKSHHTLFKVVNPNANSPRSITPTKNDSPRKSPPMKIEEPNARLSPLAAQYYDLYTKEGKKEYAEKRRQLNKTAENAPENENYDSDGGDMFSMEML